MSDKDKANLLSILDSISKIQRFTTKHKNAEELYWDDLSFDAVLMNFINIGESVSRVSSEILASISDVPWNKIKGFRNLIAHNYFGVNADEVWQIIHADLVELEMKVKKSVS